MNNDMKQLSDEKDNSNSPAYDTAQVITQGQDTELKQLIINHQWEIRQISPSHKAEIRIPADSAFLSDLQITS